MRELFTYGDIHAACGLLGFIITHAPKTKSTHKRTRIHSTKCKITRWSLGNDKLPRDSRPSHNRQQYWHHPSTDLVRVMEDTIQETGNQHACRSRCCPEDSAIK